MSRISLSITGLLFGALAVVFSSPAAATVVCANGATVTKTVTGFFPSASIPPPPLPAGCNAATTISLSGGALWTWNGTAVAAGGDQVDWSKSWINGAGYGSVTLDPQDLVVTPTSPVATATLLVLFEGVVSVDFDGTFFSVYGVTWSGSDPGVAQRLRWYNYDLLVPDGFVGDNTELPSWASASTLLHEELRIGPWSETIFVQIPGADPSHYILAVNALVTSVPEPATLALLGLGLAGLGVMRRKHSI